MVLCMHTKTLHGTHTLTFISAFLTEQVKQAIKMEIMKEYKDDGIFLCLQESGAAVGQETRNLSRVALTRCHSHASRYIRICIYVRTL